MQITSLIITASLFKRDAALQKYGHIFMPDTEKFLADQSLDGAIKLKDGKLVKSSEKWVERKLCLHGSLPHRKNIPPNAAIFP